MEHLKIKSILLLLTLALFSLLVTGCYKDNEEELYGTGDCNTENVSFSTDVWPVINNRCVSCHTGTAASGGMRMANHTELVNTINSGRFLGAIKHQSGFSPMPQGAAKLDDCTISKIEAWINDGMLQN